VTKIDTDRLNPWLIDLDLEQLVSEAMGKFARHASAKGTEPILDVQPDVPPFVVGDPVLLRQILSNVLSNAVRFTRGGEITVTLRSPTRNGEIALVRFSVKDTGSGIPVERHELIFEGLGQSDSSLAGTYGGGLGLPICQRLVALMGGTLGVESEVGEGSEFAFELPLRVARTPAIDPGTITASLEGLLLLVIDDNAAARRIVRRVGEAEGGTVDEAEGGREAIRMLDERGETSQVYDVVVLDSLMPETDGFAVAEAVSSMPEAGRPKVLMLSAAATADEAARARSLGVRAFLEKPVSPRRLLRALTALLTPGREPGMERRMLTGTTLDHFPASGRILLADDSKVNQHVVASMLKKRGYLIDVVDDGSLAVDAALAGRYDVVLMDIEMPVMDGLDATREIRRKQAAADLPIVALTAHVTSEEKERCLSVGMNDVLAKPFRADALYEVLERWSGAAARPTVRALSHGGA
jgi:CheY-like chemotaxis protein